MTVNIPATVTVIFRQDAGSQQRDMARFLNRQREFFRSMLASSRFFIVHFLLRRVKRFLGAPRSLPSNRNLRLPTRPILTWCSHESRCIQRKGGRAPPSWRKE